MPGSRTGQRRISETVVDSPTIRISTLKLLNSYVSPFASRVRLAIYAHDLPVEIVPSGQWTEDFQKSPDYLAINPIGRVPTLLLSDGSALPELCRYQREIRRSP